MPLPTGRIAFENEGAQLGTKVVAQNAAQIDKALLTAGACSSTGGLASFSGAILLPCVLFFGLFSRRKRLRALLLAACVFLVGSGCAGQKVTCFAAAGNYTLAVTGASGAGSTVVTATTTVTFTVGSKGVISGAAN